MSKRIEFYTISFQDQNGIINFPAGVFFESIQNNMFNGIRNAQVVRKIGEKWIRLFRYYSTINQRQIVIPFGKLKDKNKPYWLNDQNQLEEMPETLYDINSLGYDEDYNVVAFTTNREGPMHSDVEDYLNTFIPRNTGVSIKIEPIMHNTGIEKVRNAELVRSITLKLDLGRSLNNFYLNQVQENERHPIIAAVKSIAEVAKYDGESEVLSLKLGLGHGKKDSTLNLDSMLCLLDNINIEEEFVTEIEVNYKNGYNEKVDVAKLKNSQVLLSYTCRCKGTQVSPENLLSNINDAVADKVLVIARHNREYFVNERNYEGEELDIIVEWDNNA